MSACVVGDSSVCASSACRRAHSVACQFLTMQTALKCQTDFRRTFIFLVMVVVHTIHSQLCWQSVRLLRFLLYYMFLSVVPRMCERAIGYVRISLYVCACVCVSVCVATSMRMCLRQYFGNVTMFHIHRCLKCVQLERQTTKRQAHNEQRQTCRLTESVY